MPSWRARRLPRLQIAPTASFTACRHTLPLELRPRTERCIHPGVLPTDAAPSSSCRKWLFATRPASWRQMERQAGRRHRRPGVGGGRLSGPSADLGVSPAASGAVRGAVRAGGADGSGGRAGAAGDWAVLGVIRGLEVPPAISHAAIPATKFAMRRIPRSDARLPARARSERSPRRRAAEQGVHRAARPCIVSSPANELHAELVSVPRPRSLAAFRSRRSRGLNRSRRRTPGDERDLQAWHGRWSLT
jgi:hypothetical protein